nr:aldehyde dehydrogenase (NADP(+)) [Amycolatopsis palatopharyngis]
MTDEISKLTEAAATAAPALDRRGREWRATLLRAIADELEARREDIVAVADSETSLGGARLGGELTRTGYQARLFAEVLDEGSYLEAAIDHAGDTPMGPGPDLRRQLVPIGPVAVFGASNFPLAFSVPGGDTVSALAAGCPVIVKAHPSHPETSRLTFDIMWQAAHRLDAPDGLLGIVFGQDAGAALVADPRVKAVGFTGSLSGGRALLDIVGAREDPIPFYGELASLNPIVVTAAATRERGTQIAEGLVASITASAGQLCTKPGLVFVPSGSAGDSVVARAADLVGQAGAGTALNDRIHAAYGEIGGRLSRLPGVSLIAEGSRSTEGPLRIRPRLLSVAAAELTADATEECFGPATIIARYDSDTELHDALGRLPASLTGTIHAEPSERDRITELAEVLRAKAGRVLFDGFPTGVLVSWAQTHGGPWPSTNSQHTSVGTSAIRRFLRPVTWQNAPQFVLPPELRDGDAGVPRRIDGRLRLPR